MKKVLYILGEFEDADVEWLIEAGKKISVPTGSPIIHQGQHTDSLFFVIAGSFLVTTAEKTDGAIARVGTGEVLAEISLIDGHPPTATVTAGEDGVVLAIPKTALERKLQEDLGFAARFYRAMSVFLADRLRSMVQDAGGGTAPDLEMGLDELDTVSKAGIRFEHILNRLQEY